MQLFNLGVVFIKRPLLIMPTLKASTKAMTISQEHFGKAQHKNGKANAFRHALWNVLLAKIAYKNDPIPAINWAEKVTTLHEKLAPNPPLERAMDLHNNSIGRHIFSETLNLPEEEVILFLRDEAEKAQQISAPEDVEKHLNEMVYI